MCCTLFHWICGFGSKVFKHNSTKTNAHGLHSFFALPTGQAKNFGTSCKCPCLSSQSSLAHSRNVVSSKRDMKQKPPDSVRWPSMLPWMGCMVPAPHQPDNQHAGAQRRSVLVFPYIHHRTSSMNIFFQAGHDAKPPRFCWLAFQDSMVLGVMRCIVPAPHQREKQKTLAKYESCPVLRRSS